jgi:alpha-tubulin suppressor-like RCC1 family protein
LFVCLFVCSSAILKTDFNLALVRFGLMVTQIKMPWQSRHASRITSIACGMHHTLICAGESSNRIYVPLVGLGGISIVLQEWTITLAIMFIAESGEVWAMGWGEYGQLGTGNTQNMIIPTIGQCTNLGHFHFHLHFFVSYPLLRLG